MQSTIVSKPTVKHFNYPVLKINKEGNIIILFLGPKTGTLLYFEKPCGYGLGTYRTDWFEEAFEIFNHKLEISN